jgi:hypothetical protein
MADKGTTRQVSAREALACIRRGMSNVEVMKKFKLSPQGYADLLRQLFQNKLITEEDLERRGIGFKVIKKKLEPEPLARPYADVPQAAADDDDFLDTLILTELLTFKPTAQPASAPAKPGRPEPQRPQVEEEDQNNADKKKKFNISGFFKKPF